MLTRFGKGLGTTFEDFMTIKIPQFRTKPSRKRALARIGAKAQP
jgi:hypothetical protein